MRRDQKREDNPTDYVAIFETHGLPALPEQSPILGMRWGADTGDWWARTEKGWYWLRGDSKKEWMPAPQGPRTKTCKTAPSDRKLKRKLLK